ncbi:MAG: sodium-independent anion transporter, partial [Proteobacteria bacterium]|nr:sodium-independent anion transporter [Pseudomonadota bacterium]
MLKHLFPFLRWFEKYSLVGFQKDLVAGVTVALVLIPQSMAYAQLAGLPPYYGLYAAFLPPMVAALFGSSRQLATGPVAVVSLMTAATLEPLAIAGSEGYIAYAISLALLVGVFQLALGLLRLGMVVNFLSHPVVNGFTNAAAIIIATSQLSKIFGVHVDKAEHHYETIARVVVSAFHYTHWPTFFLAALAFGIMYGLRRLNPRIPNVLVAVVVTTLVSWGLGFKHNHTTSIDRIHCEKLGATVDQLNADTGDSERLCGERASYSEKLVAVEEKKGEQSVEVLRMHLEVDVLGLRIDRLKDHAHLARKSLRNYLFEAVTDRGGGLQFYPINEVPKGLKGDGRRWRIRVGNKSIDKSAITLIGGGEVVGDIPQGLPKIGLPEFQFSMIGQFLAAAIIISLLGFMEAISIAKTMAVKTGQRLDPNQE